MIKAKFVGNDEIISYQTPDFNASKDNSVAMKDSTWKGIEKKGDDILFTNIEKVDADFPEVKTVAPGK